MGEPLDEIAPLLEQELSSENSRFDFTAAKQLEGLADRTQDIQYLNPLLIHASPVIRFRGVEALGKDWVKQEDAVPLLQEALKNKEESIVYSLWIKHWRSSRLNNFSKAIRRGQFYSAIFRIGYWL